jgi:hypothetical protein
MSHNVIFNNQTPVKTQLKPESQVVANILIPNLFGVLTSRAFLISFFVPFLTLMLAIFIALITNWCNGVGFSL